MSNIPPPGIDNAKPDGDTARAFSRVVATHQEEGQHHNELETAAIGIDEKFRSITLVNGVHGVEKSESGSSSQGARLRPLRDVLYSWSEVDCSQKVSLLCSMCWHSHIEGLNIGNRSQPVRVSFVVCSGIGRCLALGLRGSHQSIRRAIRFNSWVLGDLTSPLDVRSVSILASFFSI